MSKDAITNESTTENAVEQQDVSQVQLEEDEDFLLGVCRYNGDAEDCESCQ